MPGEIGLRARYALGYEHARKLALGTLRFGQCPYLSSVQNERRKNMLAYFYDRVQPQTPKASKGAIGDRAHTPYLHSLNHQPLTTNPPPTTYYLLPKT